jgi:hypothetical protein
MKAFSGAIPFGPGLVSAVVVSVVLSLSACSGTGRFSATAICARAGGDYVDGTCARRSSPGQLAAHQWCETHGGVYLDAEDYCAFGEGGP